MKNPALKAGQQYDLSCRLIRRRLAKAETAFSTHLSVSDVAKLELAFVCEEAL